MINEPGCCKPVAANVFFDIRTRGPKLTKLIDRSGSLVKLARTSISISPSLAESPGLRPRLRSNAPSAAMPLPSSAIASGMEGSISALPISGQCSSTAFNSTSLRLSPACSMARIWITCDTFPRAAAASMISSFGGVCRLLISRSPPSRIRALSFIPSRIDSATDPTVPIAATPTSKAPRKTRNFLRLPRISRCANCQANCQPSRLAEMLVMPFAS